MLLPLTTKNCPEEACPACKRARRAFPAHAACIEYFKLLIRHVAHLEDPDPDSASTITRTQSSCLYRLGQALLPLSPTTSLNVLGMSLKSWKSSFSATSFTRLLEICPESGDKENRSIYSILEGLIKLPSELQETIAKWIFPDSNLLPRLFIISGATSELLEEVERKPAGTWQLTTHSDIFVERFSFGCENYISRLSNEQSPNSKLSCVLSGDAVVRLNGIGVINVEPLSSLDRDTPTRYPNTEWLYAISTDDLIYVQSKVGHSVMMMYLD